MYSSMSYQRPPGLHALCGTVHFLSSLPSNSEPKRNVPSGRFFRAATLRGQLRRSSQSCIRVLLLAQFFLRHVELALHIPQFRLQAFDVLNRQLHRAGFAVALLCSCSCHDNVRAFGRSTVGSAIFADHWGWRCRRREQRRDLLKRHVDAIPPTLFGDFMRGPFRCQVGRKSFGVRNARKMRAFQDVLIIRFGREEQSRSLGAHHS